MNARVISLGACVNYDDTAVCPRRSFDAVGGAAQERRRAVASTLTGVGGSDAGKRNRNGDGESTEDGLSSSEHHCAS